MLQLQYIKDHTEEIISRLKIKNVQNVEERIAEILELDAQRRALQVSRGSFLLFLTRPVSCVFIVASLLIIVTTVVRQTKKGVKEEAEE